MTQKIFSLLALALFLFMGVGCCPLTKLNISIALDKSFQDKYGMNREVTVDVVGVKEADNDRWKTYSMTNYWEAADTMRNTPLRKTLTFNSSKLDPQVVASDDPMWSQWMAGTSDKHPPQIYVLVQIPKTFDRAKDDRSGSEDPRRQILSTSSCIFKPGAMGAPPTVHLVVDTDRLNLR